MTASSRPTASPVGRQTTLSLPSDTEIVLTRDFDAPRALVWEAMSKPERVRRWWGPRDSRMAVCEMDVLGNAQGTPGVDQHAFSGEYVELAPPERVVFTERYEPIPGSDHVITTTLTEVQGKTTLRAHIKYTSKEQRDGHLQSGKEPGMQETHQRLDELLAELSGARAQHKASRGAT